ncbi:MAG: nodulation protein NfeD [Actinomycetota bacterium]
MRKRARVFFLATVIAVAFVGGSRGLGQSSATVLDTELTGPVTPVVADYLRESVGIAEREGHTALLVRMDTPGGLDSSMRDIVKVFLNARVPVIVWVGPPGARAASAGAVIALAAHVVAMSPGTNIGAATPVTIEGEEVGDKVTNDATAYAVAIAAERGRDEDFARDIVRDGRSEPASEAVRIGAIDLVSGDVGELLDDIDGTEVTLPGDDEVVLRTAGAALVTHEMGWLAGLRQRLADPNLTYLFLSLGTLAIIYELINPGVGFGGIAGVILLLLGMSSIAVLPVNVAGILLLALAAGLFVAEVFVPGVGVFGAGGAISLVLSALFLVRGSLRVDAFVFIPTAVVVAAAVVVAGRLSWRARKAVSTTGPESFSGLSATVTQADGHTGRVFLEGTWWTVRSGDRLTEGGPVQVVGVEGLMLIVEPVADEKEDA